LDSQPLKLPMLRCIRRDWDVSRSLNQARVLVAVGYVVFRRMSKMKLLWAAFAEIGQFDHLFISAQCRNAPLSETTKDKFRPTLDSFGGITCGQTCLLISDMGQSSLSQVAGRKDIQGLRLLEQNAGIEALLVISLSNWLYSG